MRPAMITLLGWTVTLAAQMGVVAAEYRPRVGERHPDFTLPAISNGQPLKLSQFRGKKVLLIQFASW